MTDTAMKMYFFLVILLYKGSSHLSCAEFELAADGNQAESEPATLFDYSPEGSDGDYANGNGNGLVFEFRRSIKSDNTEIEARRRSALDKNFMRFGRGDPELQRVARASKQSNLMRFGRPDRGFLRFGRIPADVPYSLVHQEGDHEQLSKEVAGEEVPYAKRTSVSAEETDISDSGEQIKPKQYVYYRRNSPQNLMRFGKRTDPYKLRYKNAPHNLLRFGRAKGNLLRFGRSDPRFMRLVKMDNNFMRFGRSGKGTKSVNGTDSVVLNSHQIKQLSNDRIAANPNEDYEIQVQEEDILAPMYSVQK
uniref:Putative fmrfamide neuropeptide n=2 Tax=Culex tarsalis TaxID=7177 RepID=A0A1Q3FP43_CULTA